jgi:hypothetical protein
MTVASCAETRTRERRDDDGHRPLLDQRGTGRGEPCRTGCPTRAYRPKDAFSREVNVLAKNRSSNQSIEQIGSHRFARLPKPKSRAVTRSRGWARLGDACLSIYAPTVLGWAQQ